LPATSDEGVSGTWNPATINTATLGAATYTFTPAVGSCAAPVSLNITINPNITPTFPTVPTSICQNATAPILPATSNEGVNGTWNPAVITTAALGTTTYTFTPAVGSCAAPTSVIITITTNVTPTFPTVPTTICQNATPPTLPASSNEGVNGSWNPAVINTSTLGTTSYTFTPVAGSCAAPTSIDITIVANVTATFPTIPTSICQNATAPALPLTSNEGVNGTWNPAVISTTALGTSTYTFTPAAGSCAAPVSIDITITTNVTPTFPTIPTSICQNSAAPALPPTSNEGVNGTWNPAVINTATLGTTTYTFTPAAGSCAAPVSVDITITTNVTPTFPTLPTSICQNATAPALPPTSSEGVNGTWNPAVINTAALGTTTYTFTPAAGSCGVPVSVDITITTNVTLTFPTVPTSICQNTTAPVLPTSSNEGVSGTWNPAVINTAMIGTTSYTFTPAAGSCAAPVSVDIAIANSVTPTFAAIPTSICLNAIAPILPATSVEGISGTWNPAVINTATLGTTVYTFTPASGTCAVPATLSITIGGSVTPTFPTVPNSICQNTTAPALPATSNEGIAGTWNPAIISTTNLGTTTYTFTPAAGSCASPVSVDITVATSVTPTFGTIPTSICQNATAPVLPATSIEGIAGTWDPAVVNTSAIGTTVYTFTPTGGTCATTTTLSITIATGVTPTFPNLPTSICQNATAPALPATSNEGIDGTWSPVTINTSTAGTTAYIFTPNAGSCASSVTVNIAITGNVTPTFTTVPTSVCQNTSAPALPATSTEGINGTWNPATINTSNIGTTTYTFTPAAGSCAGPTSVDISVTSAVTPTFTTIPTALCQNTTPPVLPTTSIEGVGGTWSPALVNTSSLGTTVYTFTPLSTSCASPVTVSITVNSGIAPTFPNIPSSVCQNGTPPALPGTSDEGITGTWSPATINTSSLGTTTYTFTPTTGSCASPVSVDITVVTSLKPTFPPIPNSLCTGSTAPPLPTTSNEGVTGSWTPSAINTNRIGTIVYSFIPSPGQCATQLSLIVTVVNSLIPTFTTIPDSLCQFATAPALPKKSTEGVTGTWSPSTINTSTAGRATYTFTPDSGQCGTIAHIDVVINALPVLDMGPDITITPGSNTHLNPSITGNIISYLWSPTIGLSDPTIKDPIASPAATTTYTLDVKDNLQCENNANIKITVSAIVSKLGIPNAFSPNGDGVNDTWVITNLSAYPGATVDVFNRYGQKVFHSENNSRPWDGTYNGNALPLGTYYYVIDPKNGEKKIGGSVTIFK